jgi:hypothetical protein
VVKVHVSDALPHRNSLKYPLDRELGGTQSQSGCYEEDKNLLPLPGIEPPPVTHLSNPQPNHHTEWGILTPLNGAKHKHVLFKHSCSSSEDIPRPHGQIIGIKLV